MKTYYIWARIVYGGLALLSSLVFIGSVVSLLFPGRGGDTGDPRVFSTLCAVIFGIIATIAVHRWLYWERLARRRKVQVTDEHAA